MRLRQIALVPADLDAVANEICEVFGVDVALRDPGVEHFGLKNAVMSIGDTFVEVASPIRPDTAATSAASWSAAIGCLSAVFSSVCANSRDAARMGCRCAA